MARINIEDSWFTDPRRTKLIRITKDETGGVMVDGAVLHAWRLAQSHYKNGFHIPRSQFESLHYWQEMIESGLAEETERGFYVKGSRDFGAYLIERSEAGKRGGEKSAKVRSSKNNNLVEAKRSKRKQIEPSSSSSSSSSSSGSTSDSGSASTSSSKKEKHSVPNGTGAPPDALPPPKGQLFIAKYCERWKARWKTSVTINPRDAKNIKTAIEGLPVDQFDRYLDAFFAFPDAQLVKRKHPLSWFPPRMNELAVFATQGSFTTQTEARQMDVMASNMNLLNKVRSGEI